jgi:hypothetical protein
MITLAAFSSVNSLHANTCRDKLISKTSVILTGLAKEHTLPELTSWVWRGFQKKNLDRPESMGKKNCISIAHGFGSISPFFNTTLPKVRYQIIP